MIKDQKSSQALARKTEVHRKLKRMGRGARKVKPGGGKGPVLVLMLLLCMGWLCCGLVDGLMMGGLPGRLYGIATGLVTAALAVGLTMTLLWVWGGPLQAPPRGRSPGPDRHYQCKRGSPGAALHHQRPG